MIKELINFTNNFDEDFLNLAYRPSKGLHIKVFADSTNHVSVKSYIYYNGEDELNNELSEVLTFERYSSYISMNQQQKFDKKQKIHSASPFSLAFNFSLGSSKKEIEAKIREEIENDLKVKFNDKLLSIDRKNDLIKELDFRIKKFKINEVKKSIKSYFDNAKKLCLNENHEYLEKEIKGFEFFCNSTLWDELPTMVMQRKISKKGDIEEFNEVSILSELKEKDYIRIYLCDVPTETWKSAYEKYYRGEYPLNEFNDNDFISTYSDKKPFLTHRTASFETFKTNGVDSNILKQFKDALSVKPKIIPNPLPLFIYKEELQEEVIAYYNSNRKLSYSEIIESLWNDYKNDFNNYYLIYWYTAKDIIFQDFDFVSKFEYEFDTQIENLFKVIDSQSKIIKTYPKIHNIFQLEKNVFVKLIGNKFQKIDYFKQLDSEDYKDRNKTPNLHWDNTFQSYAKYRKTVYDFIYKSKRKGINEHIFSDMVFSHIRDDIKQNNGFSIKEKLNIWFSLYEKFKQNNNQTKITMVSKLKKHQDFVDQLSVGQVDTTIATDADFAFAAGQVIDYILKKSRSEDTSYRLLEPYLQQSKCSEIKKAITKDFDRYKHENFSKRFRNVAAFVLSYGNEDDYKINMKDLMPELLAGVFAQNQLFSERTTESN